MRKTALDTMFHHGKSFDSPTCIDLEVVTTFDESGSKHTVFKEVDYKSIIESNGVVSNWSLDALKNAGVNPNFPIHTGFTSRFEGIETLSRFDKIASDIINESKTE